MLSDLYALLVQMLFDLYVLLVLRLSDLYDLLVRHGPISASVDSCYLFFFLVFHFGRFHHEAYRTVCFSTTTTLQLTTQHARACFLKNGAD